MLEYFMIFCLPVNLWQ